MSKKSGRYWMFSFDKDNPLGGMSDFSFSFNDTDEFEERMIRHVGKDTYQILDTDSNYHYEGDFGTVTRWVCNNVGLQ